MIVSSVCQFASLPTNLKNKVKYKPIEKNTFIGYSKLAKYVYTYKDEVLVCETDKDLILVFQGTNTVSDWVYNLSFNKKNDIHTGFYEYSLNILAKYDIKSLIESCNKPIFFVGHSRASCCAIIILFELAMSLQYKDCSLILFGSPKPGGTTFRSEFERKLPNVKTYNFQNKKDIVCQYPPNDGFVHLNSQIYYFDSDFCFFEILKNHNIDTYIDAIADDMYYE